jgi:uncharacterized protein (DUF58 family)
MQLTFRGILLLLLTAPLIALGAWVPIAGWIALVAFLTILILYFFDWRGAGKPGSFDVMRDHDTKLSIGADNTVTLRLRSLRAQPTLFQIRDEPPDDFEVDHLILDGRIPPRGTWEGAYRVRPLHRGDYRFECINLRWRGPMGLVTRQVAINAGSPVKVYPNLLDVRRYDLLLRQNRLQEMGLRNARMFGEGNEFERLREYQTDDEYRRIDWKATARRNKPITVEYQTERSQNIVTVIDTGRMMQSPVHRVAKLDYVINAVLLLGYVATGMGDKIGMMTFAGDIQQYLAPRQGRGHFYRMLEVLYAVEPQPIEPDYRRALAYLAAKQRKRSLIIVFTDLTGGITTDSIVTNMSVLARNSLPLVVTISDPDVHEAAHSLPGDSLGVYQRAAAVQVLEDRRLALQSLQHQGVLTLDVPANQLSWAVVNRYLELKGKGLL